jgi:FtsH-binding integral membrane protein
MVDKEYAVSESKAAAQIDEGLRNYMISVYNHMSAALAVTALTAFAISQVPALLRLFFNLETGGLSALGWIALLSPLAVIFWFNSVVRNGSLTQVRGVFFLFSVLMAVSLTPTFLIYTGTSISRVFLITAATFGGMSIYGYVAKKDLTSWGSFLRMGLWGLIIAMVVNLFMKSNAMGYAISFIAVFVFTGLTAYDTQKIRQIYFSGDSNDIMTRKVVVGALELYLDFINLFIHLLRIMGDRR